MADDIGPGDVVEAVSSREIANGTRATVLAVNQKPGSCRQCGVAPFGLVLVEFRNTGGHVAWCAAHWRKIGGSQSDTVRLFAEDLNLAPKVRNPWFEDA